MEKLTDKYFPKYIHQIPRSVHRLMVLFTTIFTSFSSLIFEGVSDVKEFQMVRYILEIIYLWVVIFYKEMDV